MRRKNFHHHFDKGTKTKLVSLHNSFFHWFLEFPEVFNEGGFDCILGNPPYLGGKKISGSFGDQYLNWLKYYYAPCGGLTDFVAYFLRRNYNIIRVGGFEAIITTNTIAQGDTR